jgi:hypothetical protein
MILRTRDAAPVWILLLFLSASAQDTSNIKTRRVETCENFCWGLILKGRLIDTFEFSQCEAISGMTCHITLKDRAQLPSRVFVQALDARNRPLGKRLLLPYPELKPKESGHTSFPSRLPEGTVTVVLTGEWNGPYRSSY